MKAAIAAPLAALLASCASSFTPPQQVEEWRAEAQRTIPSCTAANECAVKWAAARDFVLANSGWKLQTVTPDLMETYSGPVNTDPLSWRVTRRPMPDGRQVIEAQAWCGYTYSACSPPAWQALRDFNRFVNASWK